MLIILSCWRPWLRIHVAAALRLVRRQMRNVFRISQVSFSAAFEADDFTEKGKIQMEDVWGTVSDHSDRKLAIAELAASIPQQLAPAIHAAHELGQCTTPDAIGSDRHTNRIAEARGALALATATLSEAVNQFRRVTELLKGVN
jgi:hypothetical protein